jgi:ABC-2 type transport system permease protein
MMPATRRPPSFARASLRILNMSLGQMLWSRRTPYMMLIVGVPLVLAIAGRVLGATGAGALHVNGAPISGDAIVGMMVWVLFVRFTVPVLGVLYGTGIVADEVDDRTITYLFTRPIPRGAVVVGKYVAYLACMATVVLPSVVLMYFTLMPVSEMEGMVLVMIKDLGALAIGLAVYGALFALTGAVVRRPLVIGLVFAFGWEPLALVLPGHLRRATVAYYLQALVPHTPPGGESTALLQSLWVDTPSVTVALLWLVSILAACLCLAARAVARREYVLEQ